MSRAFAKGLVTFPRMSTKGCTQGDYIPRIVVEEKYMACELHDSRYDDARNNRELVYFKYEVGKGALLDQRHSVVVRLLFFNAKDDFNSSLCTGRG
jgi:hypothetical protein